MQFPTLKIVREFSAENINRVVNNPNVRPDVGGGTGPLDLTGLVANPANYLLMAEGGGVLFECLEPGLYEAHTQFLADFRGQHAVDAVKDALRYMFTRSDAVEIVTKVPDGNAGALGLVRAIKGDFQFYRPRVWPRWNGVVGVKYYAKTINSWARDADGLAEIGDQFHAQLAAVKQASNGAVLHDNDDAHDRYVGAACEMIGHGQAGKGVAWYNRWARFAGYAQIAIIAANPIVLDIGDAILAVRGDQFEVLLCR